MEDDGLTGVILDSSISDRALSSSSLMIFVQRTEKKLLNLSTFALSSVSSL